MEGKRRGNERDRKKGKIRSKGERERDTNFKILLLVALYIN